MGIFAKFVFALAHVFTPGSPDLPPMVEASAMVPEVQVVPVAVVVPSCPPGAPECKRGEVIQSPRFCLAPGVYTVTIRLGLIAQTPLGGKVWIGSAAGESLLAAFTAAPGSPAYVAATLPVSSAGECVRVRVEASDAVEVMADPAVSFLVFSR